MVPETILTQSKSPSLRGSSPEELRILTRDQLAKYARVIKEMGIGNE